MKPYYETELGKLYHGDCLEIMSHLEPVDLVLTDPPYPDYHIKKYKYHSKLLKPLSLLKSRQFIFWTSKVDFPLDYTAIHIWDKLAGCASCYERIFERNGLKNYKVFRHSAINGSLTDKFMGDFFTGHTSQKPKRLIIELLEYSKNPNLTLDPFIGSGTTAIACERLNRHWIGIEIEEKYCEIAAKRIENERKQRKLF